MDNDKYIKFRDTIISKRGSFADHHPDLVCEWDLSRNNGLLPSKVTPKSGQKVWWKCSTCGFEWKVSVAHRAGGRGCPECAKQSQKKQLISYYASHDPFQKARPDLVEEWNYEKNGTLTPDQVSKVSGQKVWWVCKKCGYEWESTVANRFNGNGCPKCAHAYQTSEPEQAVLFYFNRESVDIYLPSLNLAIEYDGGVWHKDIERDLQKAKKLEENGVSLIRIRENHAPHISDNSFQIESAKTSSDLTVLTNPIKLLFEYINDKYALDLQPSIDIERDYNKIVDSIAERKMKRSFLITKPQLLDEWDYNKNQIKPEYIAAGSNKKVWWICKNGHSWSSAVYSRALQGSGCPYCAGNRAIPGESDLSTKAPDLMVMWNYKKNTVSPIELSPSSNIKVWWLCPDCGYEWENSPNQQKGKGCFKCNAKRRLIPGYNDFATLHPELMTEWDYRKNVLPPSGFTRSTNKKVWWKCNQGHEWEASIHNRVSGQGCPICSKKRGAKIRLQKGKNS